VSTVNKRFFALHPLAEILAFPGLSDGSLDQEGSPNDGEPRSVEANPTLSWPQSSRATQNVPHKRPESGKPILRIHVMLDDVKRTVIKSAEAPDGNSEEQRNLDFRMLDDEQAGG
jgi:hypothetical protein